MRSNISRRLKAHIHSSPQPVIFVRFVRPNGQFGGQPCQSNRAECDGQVWERRPRETSQDLERRVCKSLQRHEDGPTVVIFFPENRTEDRRMSEIAG
jgi:hypothetical protein